MVSCLSADGKTTPADLVAACGDKNENKLNLFVQLIFVLIIYARNPYYLYVASIIGGVIASCHLVSMPMFVSEIADVTY